MTNVYTMEAPKIRKYVLPTQHSSMRCLGMILFLNNCGWIYFIFFARTVVELGEVQTNLL